MSTCLEPHGRLNLDLVPRQWAWRMAILVPIVLAVPWVFLNRSLGLAGELGTLRGLLLVLMLSTATVTDLLWRRIYNWTTYTAFGWVVLLELLTLVLGESSFATPVISSLGMLPWRDNLMGFAAGFSILFVLYTVFHGGAGDLKLVAVLGALVGVNYIIEILIYSYILAGVFAGCLLVVAAGPGPILALVLRTVGFAGPRAAPSTSVRDCLKRRLPMAPFIASGTLLAMVLS